MKNFLKNLTGFSSKSLEKGFSLAEAMVATAILGIVITATISQLRLSSKSATEMAGDAEINSVTNKIISAIGTTSVCRANFGGKVQNATYTFIVDSNGDHLIDKGSSAGSSGTIKVSDIETKKISDNEMVLVLSFQKKRFGVTTFFGGPKREIPINTILSTVSPTLIEDCFANYDLVIRTAIQQSCEGNSSYYNANTNLPYGACEHNVISPTTTLTKTTPIQCGPGQFLKAVRGTIDGGPIVYTCGKFTEDCPAGQAVVGFNAAGVVQCQYIFKTCAPGEVIMKVGGQHVCKKLDCGPSTQLTLSAFRGFDVSGNLLCTPITTAAQCPNGQYATQITSDGTVTCSTSPFAGGSCGIGQYITGINASGGVICTTYIQVPFTCPPGGGALGQAITGVKDDGTPDCEPINSVLKCGGTTKTYNDCVNAGGLVQTGANSHCKFNGPTCPGGWTRCSSIGSQWEVSCRDTSNTFYCNQWIQNRGIAPWYGNGPYQDQGQRSVSCSTWVGTPGTQGRCDEYVNTNTVWTRQDNVGCK